LLEAGTVKHIVKLSALGVEDGGKFIWGMEFLFLFFRLVLIIFVPIPAKEHCEHEEYIKKAGIQLTSIRPSSFDSNLFRDTKNIKLGVCFEKKRGSK
jgi:hypothetical protein